MKHFHEIQRLEKLVLKSNDPLVRPHVLTTVKGNGHEFPIFGLSLGSSDKSKPTLGLFGGVHGLERVGSHVILAYLESFFEQLRWDSSLRELLEKVRLVTIPVVNPGGMFFGYRSNLNGVDLMRNAPIECEENAPWLVGGHRISPKIPWYRGKEGDPMEIETQTLIEFVKNEIFPSKASLTIDFHSGFGLEDRLWYPYAKSRKPFPKIHQALALKNLFDRTYQHHIYKVEPQSVNYTTHGDIWDHLVDEHISLQKDKAETEATHFLPWTLEMGSWQWVRKNPTQLFNALGPYNPIKPHRYKRVMRRHITLVDFFLRSALNWKTWAIHPEKGILQTPGPSSLK